MILDIHRHIEECDDCRTHPLLLCEVGKKLLKDSLTLFRMRNHITQNSLLVDQSRAVSAGD